MLWRAKASEQTVGAGAGAGAVVRAEVAVILQVVSGHIKVAARVLVVCAAMEEVPMAGLAQSLMPALMPGPAMFLEVRLDHGQDHDRLTGLVAEVCLLTEWKKITQNLRINRRKYYACII